MQHHQFTDDTQIYFAVRAGEKCAVDIKKIEERTLAVQDWFLQNDLQLKPAEPEVITLTALVQRHCNHQCG